MQTLAQIRDILNAHGLSAHKRFGQNFLIDQNLGRKLVDAAAIAPDDLVLEIGPGTGTLSEEILARGASLIACELDRGLCEHLRVHFQNEPRFTLLEGDCLARNRTLAPDLQEIIALRPFRLIANLPYGAASPIMSTLLIDHPNCQGLFVTIQREVADKLVAAPRTKQYGPMALLAWASAQTEWVATAPPTCFWPRPDVTSAMVALRRRSEPFVDDLPAFSEFLTRAFRNRRKQLGSVLALKSWPEGVDPRTRAEALEPEQIVRLWRHEASITETGP